MVTADRWMRDSLRTARLALRLPVASDADELHAIFSDPRTNTIGDGPFTSPDQTAHWIARRQALYAEHGLAWYLVRAIDGGLLLGNCGMLTTRGTVAEPEIGYMIRSSNQGRGYASEAAEAVLAEAAAAGIEIVWSTIRPGNLASCRVIERAGFHVQRTENDRKGPLRYYKRSLREAA
ncbi:Protein N-acetyltransferase, RimJ/RimL family [Blastococcus aggregatus]|uniref:Protein N-acetyltransferase, RimJ/RimL family n=1 Tax=Blastococcus aggregatus TaxID=38502 RepID=A0A285UWG0_9ACTN|nr:GNAT family N-acetyltransferase [Blastococcus aggregatus]SOC46159.1 Protein N-acetyltransferase, RimJ/RimL family [Blastococcus aggregatus]